MKALFDRTKEVSMAQFAAMWAKGGMVMNQCSIVLLLADDLFRNITDFEDFEDIGEIQEVLGLPDGITLNAENFAALKAYAALSDDKQEIMLAYYRATDVFNPDAAMEAYVGYFVSGAEFADYLAYECCPELKDLPDWIALHIDWQAVWDAELHYEYFEQDDHYFRNM